MLLVSQDSVVCYQRQLFTPGTATFIDSTPLPICNALLSCFSFDHKQPQNTCPFQIYKPSLSVKLDLSSTIPSKKKKSGFLSETSVQCFISFIVSGRIISQLTEVLGEYICNKSPCICNIYHA